MANDKQLRFWFSPVTLLCLIITLLIPFTFPILAQYEGHVLPVVVNVEIEEVLTNEEGVFINVRFDKVRSCEFIGISWYDQLGQRVIIDFDPDGVRNSLSTPSSRPVRDNQVTGPWQLVGLTSLEESIAIVSHRCHPFWTTFTNFFT